ncbi:hypothetical protein KBA73_01660 [Patescibacteria group bacterium]|nr:hypothetical protein [Patescibacteria group bacterium]
MPGASRAEAPVRAAEAACVGAADGTGTTEATARDRHGGVRHVGVPGDRREAARRDTTSDGRVAAVEVVVDVAPDVGAAACTTIGAAFVGDHELVLVDALANFVLLATRRDRNRREREKPDGDIPRTVTLCHREKASLLFQTNLEDKSKVQRKILRQIALHVNNELQIFSQSGQD